MVGTFPLSVQEGSPQYTTIGEITPASGTTTISVTNPDSIVPISNAYYTIQNADGSKWCTFYVSQWTTSSANNYTGTCTYSSSNTSDVFPEGSPCWCIWCKEYYDSLITPISTINNEISTINNNISTINNEIDTITPKVDDSFVSATKPNSTTLRLTRNDGSTVDISFPNGLNVRFISGQNVNAFRSDKNELVVVESCILTGIHSPSSFISIENGLGYLTDTSTSGKIAASGNNGYNVIILGFGKTLTVSGLLYDGAYVLNAP